MKTYPYSASGSRWVELLIDEVRSRPPAFCHEQHLLSFGISSRNPIEIHKSSRPCRAPVANWRRQSHFT
jgi:hypothetical protein